MGESEDYDQGGGGEEGGSQGVELAAANGSFVGADLVAGSFGIQVEFLEVTVFTASCGEIAHKLVGGVCGVEVLVNQDLAAVTVGDFAGWGTECPDYVGVGAAYPFGLHLGRFGHVSESGTGCGSQNDRHNNDKISFHSKKPDLILQDGAAGDEGGLEHYGAAGGLVLDHVVEDVYGVLSELLLGLEDVGDGCGEKTID